MLLLTSVCVAVWVVVEVRRKVLARDPDEEIARVGRVGRSPHDPANSDTDTDLESD